MTVLNNLKDIHMQTLLAMRDMGFIEQIDVQAQTTDLARRLREKKQDPPKSVPVEIPTKEVKKIFPGLNTGEDDG